MALDFTDDEFRRVRFNAQANYQLFGSIRNPYLQTTVAFNMESFRHLLFKSWNRGRDRRDQFMRLKYIDHAPQILQLSRTVQGIKEANEWERYIGAHK